MPYFNIYFALEMLLNRNEYYSVVFQIKKNNKPTNSSQFLVLSSVPYTMREPKAVTRNKGLPS